MLNKTRFWTCPLNCAGCTPRGLYVSHVRKTWKWQSGTRPGSSSHELEEENLQCHTGDRGENSAQLIVAGRWFQSGHVSVSHAPPWRTHGRCSADEGVGRR